MQRYFNSTLQLADESAGQQAQFLDDVFKIQQEIVHNACILA